MLRHSLHVGLMLPATTLCSPSMICSTTNLARIPRPENQRAGAQQDEHLTCGHGRKQTDPAEHLLRRYAQSTRRLLALVKQRTA